MGTKQYCVDAPPSPKMPISSSFPHYIYAIPAIPPNGHSAFAETPSNNETDLDDELHLNPTLPLPPRLRTPAMPACSPCQHYSSSISKVSSSLKWKMSSLSFRNKEFDPFAAAAENVRKEDMAAETVDLVGNELNNEKKSRTRAIFEFFSESKITVTSRKLKEEIISMLSMKKKNKKKKSEVVRVNAEEMMKCESLARYKKSLSHPHLTPWFGSARYHPKNTI